MMSNAGPVVSVAETRKGEAYRRPAQFRSEVCTHQDTFFARTYKVTLDLTAF